MRQLYNKGLKKEVLIALFQISYLLNKKIRLKNSISHDILGKKNYDISFLNLETNGTKIDINVSWLNPEKIRKIILINKELSYENGFMTQTLKIKKDKVFKFYEKEIRKLYHNLQ